AVFMANLIPTPNDAMLFEITNESIALAGGAPISITADYFFQAASAIVMTLVVGFVIVRIVEPRLGKYDPAEAGDPEQAAATDEVAPELEARGLKRAGLALLGVLAIVLLATLPPGAPRRVARGARRQQQRGEGGLRRPPWRGRGPGRAAGRARARTPSRDRGPAAPLAAGSQLRQHRSRAQPRVLVLA